MNQNSYLGVMMVKFLLVLILLTLSNLSLAQNADEILEQLEEVQNATIIPPSASCNQTSESNTPEQCEIFTQVCLDSEDNNTGEKIFSDKKVQTIDVILELYNDYARLKGKDSFDELFKEHMQQNGFKLGSHSVEDTGDSVRLVTNEDKPSDIKDFSTYGLGTFINDFSCNFVTKQASKEVSALQLESIPEEEKIRKAQEIYQKTKNDINKNYEKMLAKEPLALLEVISDVCRKQEESDQCKYRNKIKLKSKVLDLKRKNFPASETQLFISQTIRTYDPAGSLVIPLDTTATSARDYENSIDYNDCYNINRTIDQIGKSIYSDFITKINRSQIVIEGSIEKFYGSSMDNLYGKLGSFKDLYLEVFNKKFNQDGIIKDQDKLNKIISEYKALETARLQKPNQDRYIEEDGIKYLNTSTSQANPFQPISLDQIYNSDSLEWFTTINAFYMPSLLGEKEAVNLFPLFLQVGQENNETLLSVYAHELAHKMGPSVSKLNNHELTTELAPLMNCLASSDSFSMNSSQTEESFSDWFSSEVMVEYIKKNSPPSEHKNAIKKSLQAFCSFEDGISLHKEDPHPDPLYRVNYIYGAHPFIKEQFGCSPDSDPKYCELKK